MATIKQKRAFNKMVENGGNVSKAMKQSGYKAATAKNPKKLTDSKGFKEICLESGLTSKLITDALVEDIQGKKHRRKGELELASKILGLYQDKHEISATSSLTDLLRSHYTPKPLDSADLPIDTQ